MTSSWGISWGYSWGISWGTVVPPLSQPVPPAWSAEPGVQSWAASQNPTAWSADPGVTSWTADQ